MKGAETQFAQFVEGLIDAGVQIGGGQYPYPARDQCAIFVQPKGNLECELRIPLDSEVNGGFVARKGAAPVKLGAKFKMLKPTTGAHEFKSVVTLQHSFNITRLVLTHPSDRAGGGAFLKDKLEPKAGMWLVHIQGKLVAPLTWELIQLRLLSKQGVRPLELTFSG